MKKNLGINSILQGLHHEYIFGRLEEKKAARDPFEQFGRWFKDAARAKVPALNAMMLATADRKGKPSVRVLLLKSFTSEGLVFYSNYESAKARDLKLNPRAEVLFYWPKLERQVRIRGNAAKISRTQSLEYFNSRPRASQIGAWLSRQSAPVKNRAAIDLEFKKLQKKFEGSSVPLPPFWGGYRLVPSAFEFWQGRASRLNDRLFYQKSGKTWKRRRLQP